MYKEICEPKSEYIQTKNGYVKIVGNSLSNKQRNMLNIATRVAETSTFEKKRHGAVIVKAGRILSVGVNKWRNQDLVNSYSYSPDSTVHAEIDALSRVEDPKGAIVYVSRVNQHGEELFSRPCERCSKALIKAQVKAVVYTA
jgi:dCMP deaminase